MEWSPMMTFDWKWKVFEATERLRSRYEFIGRSTGAPFLALVYPPEAEAAFLREWHTVAAGLSPEFVVNTVNVLDLTQETVSEIGADNIVSAIADPMPGSDPASDLGAAWITRIADAVRNAVRHTTSPKPVVVLEKLAALFPVAGPREVMQHLWDDPTSAPESPVVVLIPGYLRTPRTYSFLGQREEFMYRGDLL
jgi:hypothetical protein